MISEQRAEEIAIRAIAFLAGEDDICSVFMGASGCSAQDMRARVADRDFQLAVLEFLTMDDEWVIAFGDRLGLAYDLPMQARAVLAGAAATHWT